jgi:squalene-associated FAD-dependent desaturase
MTVAVVGGGWAGIAAAVELAAQGIPVTLFEAGRVLGGRARTADIDGRKLDNGQHILLGAYREVQTLMRRVGADPDTLIERRPLQVCDGTGFSLALPRLPAPLHVAWGLLGAAAVDWPEKLKTAWWMQRLKRRRFRLESDMSVAAWLDAAGQTGVLRTHLWEPLCLAALNTPAAAASAQVFANVLRDSLGSTQHEDTDLLLPRAPLGELLPEPAARWLTDRGAGLRLGHRVRSLEPTAESVVIDGEPFAAAIVATAPQHAGALSPDLATDYEFEPITTVYLQFAPDVVLPFPLWNLLGNQGQWVVDRGSGLLACVQSGRGAWQALSDDALAAALQTELGRPGQARWDRVVREQRATFSCRPGLARPPCATAHPRLFRAGDHTWADYPATLEGAVRSGLHAARAVIQKHYKPER